MDYVKHLNPRIRDAVNNQMRIEDNVAIHAAFGGKVAAFGINGIFGAKSFDTLRNFIEIPGGLFISEYLKTVFKHFNQVQFVIPGRNYLF
jgi:hypothetical protein